MVGLDNLARAGLGVALIFIGTGLSFGQTPERDDPARWRTWAAQVQQELQPMLGYAAPPIQKIEFGSAQSRFDNAAEIETHLRLRFPHLDARASVAARADALAVDRQAILAGIVPAAGTLVIFPDHASAMTRWHESLRTAPADLVRLAIVHELARQALEARYGVSRLRAACRDAEEWLALQAVVEGRAQGLTRQVAARLGMADTFPLLARRFLSVPDVSPDAGLRLTSQLVQRDKHWAYTQGLAFWTYLESQGRVDEGAVFARLPRQTQAIERPELYLRALAAHRPDLETVLSRLEGALPSAEWTPQQQSWTSQMVEQAATLLGDKGRAEKVIQGWDEGRSLVWMNKRHPGCLVAVSVVRYDSVPGARGYFAFAVDLQRKRDELSNTPCKLPMPVVESKIGNIPLTGADESVLFEKRMQRLNSRETIPVHTLLVRRGDQVIEIAWHGLTADARWAQAILSALAAPASTGAAAPLLR